MTLSPSGEPGRNPSIGESKTTLPSRQQRELNRQEGGTEAVVDQRMPTFGMKHGDGFGVSAEGTH